MLATTRRGRKRKASPKFKANAELEKALEKAKPGGCNVTKSVDTSIVE
jgi:hypothetical protein